MAALLERSMNGNATPAPTRAASTTSANPRQTTTPLTITPPSAATDKYDKLVEASTNLNNTLRRSGALLSATIALRGVNPEDIEAQQARIRAAADDFLNYMNVQ